MDDWRIWRFSQLLWVWQFWQLSQLDDFDGIKKAVLNNNIDLVIVGPEDPLVNGVVDFFLKDPEIQNIPVIGPQAEAAQLEGSKEYSKRFMQRNNVPTAGYESFTKETLEKGLNYLETQTPPYVLKAEITEWESLNDLPASFDVREIACYFLSLFLILIFPKL